METLIKKSDYPFVNWQHFAGMKNVSMEWAMEELARISERCSNTVQNDILGVINELKRATEYEISN